MTTPSDSVVDARINNYWEKFGLWACGAIITLLVIGYQDQKSKVDKLEEKVQILYQEKVSKNELKDVEQRLMTRIEAGNADILARIDLIISTSRFQERK
jgi:hypothetical protein